MADETIGGLHDRLPDDEWVDLPEYGVGARNAAHAVHLAHQRADLVTDSAGTADEVAILRGAHEMGYRIALVPLAATAPKERP